LKSRRLFLLANIFILVLSLLTALRILPGPDLAGMALAFYALFLLPGYTITRLVSRRPAGLLERVCMIFLGSLLFLTAILLLGFVPGVSYRGIAIAGSIANAAMLLLVGLGGGVQRERSSGSIPIGSSMEGRFGTTRIVMVALLFIVCFVFFYGSGTTSWDSDALDHLSYVRRGLDSGALFPGDSFYRGGDGVGFDPRKGIWHPMLALWAYQGDTQVELLWRMLPSFIAFFALASFLLFAVTVTGRPLVAPIALLLLLFFYRGEGVGWLTRAGFSRNMAQVLLWSGAAFLIRYAETGRKNLLFWVFVSAFCIGLLLFVFFFRYGHSWTGRAVTAVAITAVAAALPLALRAVFTSHGFNLVHTHRQGMLLLSERLAMVDPVEILASLSPAFFFSLLLVPFFVGVADGGERRKLTWMLYLLPVILVLNPITGGLLERTLGYLHYRMLYAAPLFCYLSLALAGLFRILLSGRSENGGDGGGIPSTGLTRIRTGNRRAGRTLRLVPRLLAACLLILFAYFPLRQFLPVTKRAVQAILGEDEAGVRVGLAEHLDSVIPDHSVIASDPRTSYIISAFTDHFVTIILDQHCSPTDTAAIHRLRETRDLFSPAVPISRSSEWLLEQDVDYLLVDTRYRRRSDFFATVPEGGGAQAYEKFSECERLLDEIGSFDGFHLFRVDREALAAGRDLSCPAATGAAIACVTDEKRGEPPLISSDGIMLDGIVADPGEISPGDTLWGHFCWSRDRAIGFGLPFEWTIRLDSDFPKGPFYRHWYGKQYRRRLERSTGAFYRFTHSERMASGSEQPDQWEPDDRMRQDFVIAVTEWLHEGEYVMRVSLRRLSYLPNRTLGDYFLNEDSFWGVHFDSLRVRRKEEPSGDTDDVGE
jgi:hypothetical protein